MTESQEGVDPGKIPLEVFGSGDPKPDFYLSLLHLSSTLWYSTYISFSTFEVNLNTTITA